MPELLAKSLLGEAAIYFDARTNGLANSALNAGRNGFASAGEWMREALGVIRKAALPDRQIRFHRLGLAKYGAASGVAAIALILAWWSRSLWPLLLAPFLFYAVEAQMVFLFPLAIDGSPKLIEASRAWTRRAGGTYSVMKTVLPLATAMLLGGFVGKGFVRSWCLGCLAVLIWYERLRSSGHNASVSRPRLEIGASLPLHVRKETLHLFNRSQPLRLLYASDLHFKGAYSNRVAEQIIHAAEDCLPDLILLGGDLADTRHGLPLVTKTVAELSVLAPTWAIAGNHDAMVGLPAVQSAVERGGGLWLEKKSASFGKADPQTIAVDGNLVRNITATQPTILCAHDPEIFPEAIRRGYSLILAGHLHGGQFVFGERNGRLWPAAWRYRWNGLRFSESGSTMLVSRGVSDTLPIRWNCPREILLCELF